MGMFENGVYHGISLYMYGHFPGKMMICQWIFRATHGYTTFSDPNGDLTSRPPGTC